MHRVPTEAMCIILTSDYLGLVVRVADTRNPGSCLEQWLD